MARDATPQQIADYLTTGYYADQPEGQNTQYFFSPVDGDPIRVDLSGLSAGGKKLARWAMDAWECAVDVNFKEVSRGAELTFDDDRSGANVAVEFGRDGVITSAHINISEGWVEEYGSTIDSYAFRTYLHEIGHVLGMGHPGDYNSSADFSRHAEFSNDSWQMSVMSYFGQDENPHLDATRAVNVGLMEADLLAVRGIYGESRKNPTEGDTVWGVNSNMDNYLGEMFRAMEPRDTTVFRNYAFTLLIEDAGGHDKVDFSYDGRAQTVNLASGSIFDVMGQTDNILIAKGTVIEDYASGNGSDVIRGNGADNAIWANGGEDRLVGRAGDDILRGGKGADTLIGGSGRDRLYGDEFNDLLKGGGAGDWLYGGIGNDTLLGQAGHDRMRGGDAHDKIVGGGGRDKLWGQNGSDTLKGGGGNDRLFGGTGADTLRGGGGRDLLKGGDQVDLLIGGGGKDRLYGGIAGDELRGGGRGDLLDGGANGDVLYGDRGFDRLFGGDGHDQLFGGSGRDRLDGGSGNDKLTGGSGADVFIYNGGSDRITDFEAGNDRIEFDTAAIGYGDLTFDDLTGRARATDEGLVFRFDTGVRLVLEGQSEIASLANDLAIV